MYCRNSRGVMQITVLLFVWRHEGGPGVTSLRKVSCGSRCEAGTSRIHSRSVTRSRRSDLLVMFISNLVRSI